MGYITQLRFIDIETAIAFYRQHLGFELEFRYDDFYAGLSLDGHKIHFKLVDHSEPNTNWVHDNGHLHLTLEVADLAAKHAQLNSDGIYVSAIRDQPWGTEFDLRDPGGHTLYFMQRE
jgi:uncharacterized glyoxalase superfamily protein PhnB